MKLLLIFIGLGVAAASKAHAADTTPASASPSSSRAPMFEPGRLARVQALHDLTLSGEIPTYYTPGYEQRAGDMQRFLIDELKFCQKQLHIDLALSLAVLDKKQWVQVEDQMPYPMPSVTGEPPVAMMPANWAEGEGFFSATEDEASDTLKKAIAAHGLGWREANHRAGDLIGGHELGHAIIDTYGIVAGTRWLNEMLASYVLYAYLQQERRDLVWLIDVMQTGNQIDHPQHHVSLDDFESMYMEILSKDGDNYGWYQGRFLEQIKKLYARRGIDFLRQIRQAFPGGDYERCTLGNAETLRRLDTIDPSFSTWAKALAALPRKPSEAFGTGGML